ncbi:hypothetical protein J2753_001252 [Halolamina salifodinae]|uniref:Uncharacterized protein n=1 Tax=Halolamina salifodinae TaxID=1202767 RepID=A0A8T4H083_9EURY|nr:hypothetical protein [Halolamina salifodinae]
MPPIHTTKIAIQSLSHVHFFDLKHYQQVQPTLPLNITNSQRKPVLSIVNPPPSNLSNNVNSLCEFTHSTLWLRYCDTTQ